MDIYYKENTGIKTPQEHNLDYFKVIQMGINYQTNTEYADVIFYEIIEDAQTDKVPPAQRRIEWALTKITDSTRLKDLLKISSHSTGGDEVVTFNGALIQV